MAKGFALSWSPAVAMTPEEIDVFLSGRLVARIATVGPDGIPFVNPVWYYWDGGALYMVIKQSRRMAKNLAQNPWCSTVIDTDDRLIWGIWENRAKGVVVTGRAELYGPEDTVTISAGPFQGSRSVGEAGGLMLGRYGLGPAQGAVGADPGRIRELMEKGVDDPDSLLYRELTSGMIAKITPQTIRAWDFSKAAPKDATD